MKKSTKIPLLIEIFFVYARAPSLYRVLFLRFYMPETSKKALFVHFNLVYLHFIEYFEKSLRILDNRYIFVL